MRAKTLVLKRTSFKSEGLLLIPLIDILLVTIFFLMNNTFTETSTLNVNVPSAVSGESSLKQDLTVSLARDRTLTINGVVVTLDSFSTVLTNLNKNRPEPFPQAFLVADGEVPYDLLIRIMDKIRLGGIENISLVTHKAEP